MQTHRGDVGGAGDAVSVAETVTGTMSAAQPIVRIPRIVVPATSQSSEIGPDAGVTALVLVAKSTTSAPATGCPVASSKTPRRRAGMRPRAAAVVAVGAETVVTNAKRKAL
jgi:hypothetical protein